MKKLKLKRIHILSCWNNLRATPPKEFPTIDEMEKTGEILDALKEQINGFLPLIEKGEKINREINSGSLKPEKIMEKRREFIKESEEIENKIGQDMVEIEFENDAFNTFFQQFERWGKNWFSRVDEFLSARKSFNETNSKPIKATK